MCELYLLTVGRCSWCFRQVWGALCARMSWWSECPARRLLKEVYCGFRGSFLLSEGDPMLLVQWAVLTVALGGRSFHCEGCCCFPQLWCGWQWLCCCRRGLITHFVGCGSIFFWCIHAGLLLTAWSVHFVGCGSILFGCIHAVLLLRARSVYQHVHGKVVPATDSS